MKKLFILLLNLLIITSLLSCKKNIYNDGIFIGKGDNYSYGYDDATISIDEGKMVDLTLRHFDQSGKEINYEDWTGKEVNGITNPNLQKYRGDIIQEVLERQSGEVDIIQEIPEISSNWKLAINRALEKAKK
ncbi:hypothetical protein UT300005_33060 [Clostridium sp. CTA-5]